MLLKAWHIAKQCYWRFFAKILAPLVQDPVHGASLGRTHPFFLPWDPESLFETFKIKHCYIKLYDWNITYGKFAASRTKLSDWREIRLDHTLLSCSHEHWTKCRNIGSSRRFYEQIVAQVAMSLFRQRAVHARVKSNSGSMRFHSSLKLAGWWLQGELDGVWGEMPAEMAIAQVPDRRRWWGGCGSPAGWLEKSSWRDDEDLVHQKC